MFSVFTRFKAFFVVFVVLVQIQTCFLQSHWKSQKRSAEANASEAPKTKAVASILTHQLQRRLLPKTEMQQLKVGLPNATQSARKSNRINDVDEIGGNELNRVSDLNNFIIDDLPVNDSPPKQGECTNCGSDDSSSSSNKCSMPLTLLKSGDKRYYIGTFFKANWYRAAQYCRYHGMHLASISNQEENDKLEKYVTDYGFGFEHFWTSGTDLAEEGSFFWMANGKPFIFTNWNAGEPNNFKYENGEEEHCMELWNRDGKGLKWNDSPCSFETYFICEM